MRDEALQPFGAIGPVADRQASVCRCGAGPRPGDGERCTRGHLMPGNVAAVVVGERSAAFWAAHEAARRETRRAVIEDAGYHEHDAPEALQLAADGIGQARLLRDSAFLRVVESGGPMTAKGRARRAFTVWLAASDRLERYLRLVGLARVPKPSSAALSPAAFLTQPIPETRAEAASSSRHLSQPK